MRILTKQLLQNHPGWRKSILEIRRLQVGVSGVLSMSSLLMRYYCRVFRSVKRC